MKNKKVKNLHEEGPALVKFLYNTLYDSQSHSINSPQNETSLAARVLSSK